MSFQRVIQEVRGNLADHTHFLFIAGAHKDLTLKTEAALGPLEYDGETDVETFPADLVTRGLSISLGVQALEDCIVWADRLAGKQDDAAVVETVRYYLRYDAFPERLDAPKLLSYEEDLAQRDRQFYDKLGEEDATRPCRREGCQRGAVRFSVLCRPHHFESIQKRPCPFND